MSRKRRSSSVLFAIIILVIVGRALRQTPDDTDGKKLVLYCAQDAVHAESVIRSFERKTGIHVEVRFDEEASKSLGLTNLLVAEKDSPRCDVFWNNQTLGTIRLKSANVLQPYVSPNSQRIPLKYRDAKGYWTGFAARLRVYLVNTDRLQNIREDSIAELLSGASLERVAIAKPQFGTTLSHYSVVAAVKGMDGLRSWQSSLVSRGIQHVRGNSMTKDLVAEGVCDLGFTDTDDAFVAIDAGKPVQMYPIRVGPMSHSICLPNSVAMICDCPHPESAKAFIDFMLSAETELALARSSARQIPLGPVDETKLSAEVRQLQEWAADSIDLKPAAEWNQQVLDWLTAEHRGP